MFTEGSNIFCPGLLVNGIGTVAVELTVAKVVNEPGRTFSAVKALVVIIDPAADVLDIAQQSGVSRRTVAMHIIRYVDAFVLPVKEIKR